MVDNLETQKSLRKKGTVLLIEEVVCSYAVAQLWNIAGQTVW